MTPLPPNGTFPKIHPIWRRHPSLSQTEDEPGILIKDWGLCHTSSGTSYKGVAPQQALKGDGAKWQQSGETFSKCKVQSTECKVAADWGNLFEVQSAQCKYKVHRASAKYKVQSGGRLTKPFSTISLLPLHPPLAPLGPIFPSKKDHFGCIAGSKVCRWLIMRPDKVAMKNFVQSLWSQHALSKIWSRLKPYKDLIKILVAHME